MTEAESRWDPEGEEARGLREREDSMWNRDYFERILEPLLEIPNGGRALDVGTGLGALAILLHAVRPDLEIVGVDSEAGLVGEAESMARARGLDSVRFEVGDAADLPFPDGSFDVAMCQTLLSHVLDPARVVREMARVLKSGGTFLTAEWSDRALTALPVDNVAAWDWPDSGDALRLTKAYTAGRRALGRGDDEAGLRAPFLALDAGLMVLDVRLNDRVWYALPPYRKQSEADWVSGAREWAVADAPDEELRTWTEENILAAGGSEEDVRRYLELTESPDVKRRWREAIDAKTFAVVSTIVMVATVARKP